MTEIHEPDENRVYCVRCGAAWPCQQQDEKFGSRRPQGNRGTAKPAAGAEMPKVGPRSPGSGSKARVASVPPTVACVDGTCPTGCSHLMWQCDGCSCEGGWGAARERLQELADAHVCPPPPTYIDIVFDGPPAHEGGRFVEVENERGESVKLGEWVERSDGFTALRIPTRPQDPAIINLDELSKLFTQPGGLVFGRGAPVSAQGEAGKSSHFDPKKPPKPKGITRGPRGIMRRGTW